MKRLSVIALAMMLSGCGGKAATMMAGGDGSTDASGVPACGDSAFFTACVQACGETTETEGAAASCVDGTYRCNAPLIPATACGAGAWTVPRLTCGPWVEGYDCGVACAVCDADLGWTCGPCPDAGAGDGP